MIKIHNGDEGFEIELFWSLRLGYSIIDGQNHPDYAIMFHIGFLNPGITIMLSWRR